jgi:hypothetical protein
MVMAYKSPSAGKPLETCIGSAYVLVGVAVSGVVDRCDVPWTGIISQLRDVALGLGPCDIVDVDS